MKKKAIGVFDSGYGGLTVLRSLRKALPEYDFLYLGDNARNPYGMRSFDVVYDYTLQAVTELFDRGCHLVILACNTASAKALRNIQQNDLPRIAPNKRVLGVIRPSIEYASQVSQTGRVGILATIGTVASNSYPIEFEKWSGGKVKHTSQQACPMWVPIVENNEVDSWGAKYFIEKDIDALLAKDDKIDTLLLACTHYPILSNHIKKHIEGSGIHLIEQGDVVAKSLIDYLKRHEEIDQNCTKEGSVEYLTTENHSFFEQRAKVIMGEDISVETIVLASH